MKQELTITILLLAAGVGLWMWKSDLNIAALIDSRSQHAKVDQEPAIGQLSSATDDNTDAINVPGHQQTVEFLQRCAAKLRNVPALNSELQVDLNLPGAPIRLSGRYIQSGQGGQQSRTELILPTADGQITLLKICDGRFLYTQLNTPQNKTLEFVDLEQCTQRRNYDQQTEPGNPMRWIADGGISSVFENLAEAFEFEPIEVRSNKEGRVFIVRGRWNQTKLAEMLHESMENHPGFNWKTSPVHLPHAVEIEFVEQATFEIFPRRLELLRYQAEKENEQSIPVASILFAPPEVSDIPVSDIVKLEQGEGESVETTLQYVNQIISFNYARRTAEKSDTQSR